MQTLAEQFRRALGAGQHAQGRRLAEQALRLSPGNPTVLADYALCLMRTGDYEAAYRVYRDVEALPEAARAHAGATWLDGLAEVCGWLGKHDELRQYGLRSLRRADAHVAPTRRWRVPQRPPPPFDATRPDANVIAYSVFGDNPRYCEPVVLNARLTRELFPGWTCRVYLDASVPPHVTQRLRLAGAQVVTIDPAMCAAMPGTMWRFLVADDASVQRFLVRDADALLSEREAAAVTAWIDSGRWFHHMRDYFTHTELLLAGMWGGCRGAFPSLAPMIVDFAHRHRDAGRYLDQHFLREMLWPTIRDSVLNHDELFGFHDARAFPAHAPVRWPNAQFHVGSNASYRRIGGPSTLADGDRQTVVLMHDDEPPLAYQASVTEHAWSLDFPFFLADALEAGRLRIDLPTPPAP